MATHSLPPWKVLRTVEEAAEAAAGSRHLDCLAAGEAGADTGAWREMGGSGGGRAAYPGGTGTNLTSPLVRPSAAGWATWGPVATRRIGRGRLMSPSI